MGYINKVQVDNTTHLIEPTLFAITDGTASAITASISNFELVTGVVITLQIRNTNASNATLSINSGEAKGIYYQGVIVGSNILKQGYIYNLLYDGNVWHVIGEKLGNIQLAHKLTFGAGGAYEFDGSVDVTVPVYTGSII